MSSNVGWYPFVWKGNPVTANNYNPMTYLHGSHDLEKQKKESYAVGTRELKNPNPLDKVGHHPSFYNNTLFLSRNHEKVDSFHIAGTKTDQDVNKIDFSNYYR
jgi:hypothetical protein